MEGGGYPDARLFLLVMMCRKGVLHKYAFLRKTVCGASLNGEAPQILMSVNTGVSLHKYRKAGQTCKSVPISYFMVSDIA